MNTTSASNYKAVMPAWDRLGINTTYQSVCRILDRMAYAALDLRYSFLYVAPFEI